MAKPSEKLEKILAKLDTSKVDDVNIISEIEQSFLDYSMSVITSRALPDLKDGLKPVHRRIIYAAHQEGLYNNKKFKKSAALVGTVMGSYHPHGDLSIYEALARLSQDFNMRYPLIEGQGNFGSIDGDSPAAMRYTEVKLSKLGEFFLDGIKEDAVNFVPNYDGSKEEPTILPTVIPNILLNGCTGIAVGLATHIPPHNIAELCDGICALIEKPELTVDELLEHVKGPDFPTGGELLNYKGVKKYLKTGSGSFSIRPTVIIEEESKKNLLIIKEIPYGVKKLNLIKKIISLVKPNKYEESVAILANNITNIRDESSLEGIRLIIECKKEVHPQIILNNLYKFTSLQEQYASNVTVLVDAQPRILNILEILKLYLQHQIQMLIRRSKFNLKNIVDHIHILEGRKTVSDHLLEVVEIISKQDDPETALKDKYTLTDIQVKDILSLPLKSVKKIEQIKLIKELEKELEAKKELEETLESKDKQFDIIKNKVLDLKNKFGDPRRTRINEDDEGYVHQEDLISTKKVVITLSEKGYISQIPLETFRVHKRGGVGVKGSAIYQDDNVKMLITCFPLNDIFLFTDLGKVYKIKAYKLDLNSNRTSKGQSILSVLQTLQKNEKIITILQINKEDYKNIDLFLLFATKNGVVKKTKIAQYEKIRCNGKIAFGLRKDDQLKFVIKTATDSEIILASSSGKVVKFKSTELKSLGRMASGVRGIRLTKVQTLVSASSSLQGEKVFSIGEYGVGKMTPIDAFRLTKRGSVGVKAQKITARTGAILACTVVNKEQEILLMTNKNKINRFKISDVAEYSRVSAGVNLFKLDKPKEKIVYFAINDSTDDGNLDSNYDEQFDDEYDDGHNLPNEDLGDSSDES